MDPVWTWRYFFLLENICEVRGFLLGGRSDLVQLGITNNVDIKTSKLALEEFESRRYSQIGPLNYNSQTVPPIDDPGRWMEKNYTYGSIAHANAVTKVLEEKEDTTGINIRTAHQFTYDANGNMVTRNEGNGTFTHTYNAENRLASIYQGSDTWTFFYDGDGNRVKEEYFNGTTTVTRYFFAGRAYEVEVDDSTTPATETIARCCSIAGTRIAMNVGGHSPAASTLHTGCMTLSRRVSYLLVF